MFKVRENRKADTMVFFFPCIPLLHISQKAPITF